MAKKIAENESGKGQRDPTGDASAALSRKMAEDFFRRIKDIKAENPEASRIIDRNERQIQQALWNIRNAMDLMPEEQKELVRILVIHGVSKAADDILLEES